MLKFSQQLKATFSDTTFFYNKLNRIHNIVLSTTRQQDGLAETQSPVTILFRRRTAEMYHEWVMARTACGHMILSSMTYISRNTYVIPHDMLAGVQVSEPKLCVLHKHISQ